MTIVHVLLGFASLVLAGYCGFELGLMRGASEGRQIGYQQCLGAIDSDEDARKVWRAQR